MFARMFTIEGRREQLDEFARIGEKKVLWALQRLDGFEGLVVLAKHHNGKILVVTLWESEEAMRSGEEASYWFRAFSAKAAGGEVTSVERYEVVFSERRRDAALAGVRDLLFGREVAATAAECSIEIPSPPGIGRHIEGHD
jgi:heme-degrading monooxygenase HmoA